MDVEHLGEEGMRVRLGLNLVNPDSNAMHKNQNSIMEKFMCGGKQSILAKKG